MTLFPWRIIFFGTPSFAIPALESLFEGPDEVVAVVTQPDRPKGRGRRVVSSPVKALALKKGISILQPEKTKEETFQEALKGFRPDCFAVVAYGQILAKDLLAVPRFGSVNVHASLLPMYRGAAPIQRAILNGERKTGVTTMMLDQGMDTGDILLQFEVPIEEDDTGESLHDRLAVAGARLLMETIEGMKEGKVRPTPQDHTKATYAPPIRKEEGFIDWRKGAEEIDRQVRAFNPWPGACTQWGNQSLKIFRGKVREARSTGRPGTVLWVGLEFIEVETGKGSILIEEVQLEGKRRMIVRDFLQGHPISTGTEFG